MNNILKNGMKAALFATVVTGAAIVIAPQQASAFTIGNGNVLNLNGGAGSVTIGGATAIDFNNGVGGPGSLQVTGGSTGGFASLIGKGGNIADLSYAEVAAAVSPAGANKLFLQLFTGAAADFSNDVFFTLNKITGSGITPVMGAFDVGYATFKGTFSNASGAILGEGNATVQLLDNAAFPATSSWSMSIIASNPGDPNIPTPALLPGIAAMGASLLRKRKQAAATA
jgi:hypothetical protein